MRSFLRFCPRGAPLAPGGRSPPRGRQSDGGGEQPRQADQVVGGHGEGELPAGAGEATMPGLANARRGAMKAPGAHLARGEAAGETTPPPESRPHKRE